MYSLYWFQVREALQRMGALLPMNIFLRQEIDRIQRVILEVRKTLTDLKLAIDGTIVMSQGLKSSLDAMYDARIPEKWQKVSQMWIYLSMKPLQALKVIQLFNKKMFLLRYRGSQPLLVSGTQSYWRGTFSSDDGINTVDPMSFGWLASSILRDSLLLWDR
jgi:Dynein heavy chain.